MRAASLLVVALALPARAQDWVPLGPTGGDVRALAVDPQREGRVYLGTADGVLYVSDDAGRRWRRLTPGFPQRGMSLDNLVVDSRGRLLAGYWEVEGKGGGVARSLDGGVSFTLLPGIAGESVRALEAAASDPDILVAGTLSGVFRSEDGGDTWKRMSPAGHPEIRNVESVAIDPLDPRIVYAGTWHLPWKTTDAGRSWREIHVGMIDDSDVFTITLDRRTPRTVYATACSGIYRSLDAAGRWAKIRGIPSSSRRTRSFLQDASRAGTLYAGTTEGLFVSEDDAASWRLATSNRLVVNAVAQSGGALVLGTEAAGVLRSEDGGRSFAASNEGFAEHLVSRLLFQPGSGRLIAGIIGDRHHSGVLTAPQAEGPWTKLGEGLEGREVLAIALLGDEVVAGTDDGVFVSVSHCGQWRRLPTLEDGLDLHPRAVDVAAADAGRLLIATQRGLLRSQDGGATWQRLRLGLAESVSAVAFSPRDPQLALATTALGVFRSRDGGAWWQPLAQGVGSGEIRSLRFLPSDDRIVFAATRAGLLRSVDGGRSWERRGSGLPLSDIAGLDFGGARTVYASDFRNGGLFVSHDAGASWEPLATDGLASRRVFAVAVDPARPGRLFAGAATGGLHVREPAPSTAASAGAR
jgi:photosystem II stability/assembly factor-like uncharacterized protein